MILPSFFGANSVYDEDDVKNVIVDYLAADIFTFIDPKATASLTYFAADVASFDTPKSLSSVDYLAVDTLSLPRLADDVSLTYEAVDICTYDPPPSTPLLSNFLTTLVGDTEIEFSWNTPYDNRSPITEYILQYTDCFLSDILTEDSKTIIEETNYMTTESQDQIMSEDNNELIAEDVKLIGDHYRENCTFQEYDRRKVLIENKDRLQANTQLFITEQSSGIGVLNSILVQDLVNGQPHIFRIAAVNAVGTGEFSTTGILTPIGPRHKYCDIKLFMQPNDTIDVESSLIDYSCREKTINQLAVVEPSTESKFGLGSLYFNGVYDSFPNPGTYPHIRVNNNSGITGDDWSLNDDFTIELWARPSSSNRSDTLMSAYSQFSDESEADGYNGDVASYWKLNRTSNSVRFTSQYQAGSNFTLTASNTSLATGDFTHIAVSRFNNIARLYINGQLKDQKIFHGNTTISGSLLIVGADQGFDYDASDTFGIGRGSVNAGSQYIGYIDDIMISDSARYAKTSFVAQKYVDPSDCDGCGGYAVSSTLATVSDEFIP
jgi:hypothetical protein